MEILESSKRIYILDRKILEVKYFPNIVKERNEFNHLYT